MNATAPPPNVPPTVSLTAPSGGSVFNPGAVTVRATASDTNGTVARVDFRAGTQLIGSDSTNPYEVTWTAGPVGPYSLTAVAVDNQNASTTSTAVPVSVVAAAGGGVNVALASNGATATASSSYYAAGYQPPAAIDGRRSGAIRGQLGTWEDASSALPDWFQVSFAGPSTINRVNVVSMQEAWSTPVEPTTTLTSGLAAADFHVQYWNGAAWVVVPGSQVVGNTLVWKQVSFAPVTTSAIRIVVTSVAGGITRLTEVEAWTSGSAPGPVPPTNAPPTVSLTAPSGGSVFTPAAAVTVRATAGDTNGTVARVEFFAGTQLIGTDTGSPYEVTWTAGPPGSYSLTAVAVDNQNASTTSTAVPVSVAAAAGGGVNVALAGSGATATASSTYTTDYAARAAIDGRRSGAIRGQLGTWEDASGALPDWFQVTFAAPSTINRVNVFSMQEAWSAPVEPTSTLTSGLAAEDFQVQYWNGAAWVVVPGSQVVGNRLVWKQVSFAPVTTSAIRIVVTKVSGGSRGSPKSKPGRRSVGLVYPARKVGDGRNGRRPTESGGDRCGSRSSTLPGPRAEPGSQRQAGALDQHVQQVARRQRRREADRDFQRPAEHRAEPHRQLAPVQLVQDERMDEIHRVRNACDPHHDARSSGNLERRNIRDRERHEQPERDRDRKLKVAVVHHVEPAGEDECEDRPCRERAAPRDQPCPEAW